MKRVLVTGINGFVGKHLARELQAGGHEVIGASREPELAPSLKDVTSAYYVCDLLDEVAVGALPLEQIDAVVNLAGLAKVGDSFDNPTLYMHINVGVLEVIGRKLAAIKSKATVVAVSTGAVYDTNQALPLTEESRLVSNGSPYALSKIAMEQTALALRRQSLNCVIVRPFNHIGPGQESGFLVPDLYEKILTTAFGNGKLKVGDLSTRRDYTDVRDVVRAYAELALAKKLDHDIYNVCSGHSVAGQKILEQLLEITEQRANVTVQQDTALTRPNDPKDLYGSNERLQGQTGWQPTIPLEQTIRDFVAAAIR